MKIKKILTLPHSFWAGFVNGRVDLDPYQSGSGVLQYGVLYRTRQEARRCYQDVRRVNVAECPPKVRRSSTTAKVR